MSYTTLHNLEQRVPAKIYERGKKYFKESRVKYLEEWQQGEWSATVHGTNNKYAVSVSLEGESVTSWECDCPFVDGDICKHVVATLLQIKAQRKGSTAPVQPTKEERMQTALNIIKGFKQTAVDEVPEAKPLAPQTLSTEESMPAYLALSALEKLFVKTAALIWEPFSQTKFIEIFNEAGFRHEGVNLYPKDAKAMLEALRYKGLLRFANNQYRCPESFSHLLCEQIWKQDADFAKIIPAIRKRMELSYYWHYGYDVVDRHFREMRFARYSDNPALFKSHYYAIVGNSKTHTQETLRQCWMPEPFQWEKLVALAQGGRAFLLSDTLSGVGFVLLPVVPSF